MRPRRPSNSIGVLILSHLIVGIAVENLKSTLRSQMISHPMII